jgi:hypothetical protein
MITKEHYTKDGRHPLDVIHEEGDFLRKMSKIMSDRFDKLAKDLRLNESGNDWLFDYIYNCDNESMDFEEYINEAGAEYPDLVK